MPPTILSSPFLNIQTINSLLLNTPSTEIEKRIQLLSAKIHLLTNPPLVPVSSSSTTHVEPPASRLKTDVAHIGYGGERIGEERTGKGEVSGKGKGRGRSEMKMDITNPIPVFQTRLNLASAYLSRPTPSLKEAEAEVMLVEDGCKRILKRLKARDRNHGNEGGLAHSVDADEEGEEVVGPVWLSEMMSLRVEGLRMLVTLEEDLGRVGRAERWKGLIRDLEGVP